MIGNPNSGSHQIQRRYLWVVGMFSPTLQNLGDIFGRLNKIRLESPILAIKAMLQITSQDFGMSIAPPIITGFGNGMNPVTVMVCQPEISPPKVASYTFGLLLRKKNFLASSLLIFQNDFAVHPN